MDKLTLEILSAYLPWGLKVQHTFEDKTQILIVMGIHDDGGRIRNENEEDYDPEFSLAVCYKEHHKYRPHGYFYIQKNFKPLLRPLSDLYKEIEHNGERFVPAENLFNQYELKFGDNGDFYLDYYSIGETDSPWTGYGIIQQLLEWHFDVFGLIDRGMAVAIEREGE